MDESGAVERVVFGEGIVAAAEGGVAKGEEGAEEFHD